MTNEQILEMFRFNLEIDTAFMDADAITQLNAQLQIYLDAARKFITEEGITLDTENDTGDVMLLLLYAGWLYEKRKEHDPAPMPRMLRWNLNNRLFAEATGGSASVTE